MCDSVVGADESLFLLFSFSLKSDRDASQLLKTHTKKCQLLRSPKGNKSSRARVSTFPGSEPVRFMFSYVPPPPSRQKVHRGPVCGVAGECLTLECGNGSSVTGGRKAECPVVG